MQDEAVSSFLRETNGQLKRRCIGKLSSSSSCPLKSPATAALEAVLVSDASESGSDEEDGDFEALPSSVDFERLSSFLINDTTEMMKDEQRLTRVTQGFQRLTTASSRAD